MWIIMGKWIGGWTDGWMDNSFMSLSHKDGPSRPAQEWGEGLLWSNQPVSNVSPVNLANG